MIINDDVNNWITKQNSINCLVTSMPDKEETDLNHSEWNKWFKDIAFRLMNITETYAVFYQTDRKYNGKLIPKDKLLYEAAQMANMDLIYHKIVLKVNVDKVNLYRPGYSHILFFSKDKRTTQPVTPDVFHNGKMYYKNSIGENALNCIYNILDKYDDIDTITDSFCGKGSILCAAKERNYNYVGVEILSDYCDITNKRLAEIMKD